MKLRNQVDDEKSMKGRKVKGEKVVQVVQSSVCVSCTLCCARGSIYVMLEVSMC